MQFERGYRIRIKCWKSESSTVTQNMKQGLLYPYVPTNSSYKVISQNVVYSYPTWTSLSEMFLSTSNSYETLSFLARSHLRNPSHFLQDLTFRIRLVYSTKWLMMISCKIHFTYQFNSLNNVLAAYFSINHSIFMLYHHYFIRHNN